MLHTIVDNFIEQGFRKFYVSVNYKAEMIKEYFGDGTHLDIEVRYIEENKRMGTAGALSLIEDKQHLPLIVMNGDILTKVNFKHLLAFHNQQKALATMCVREYNFTVPYGVVKTAGSNLLAIEEKPVQRFFINAGIYVLSQEALDKIPYNGELDMPQLFENIISANQSTVVFPIMEYWLDIGHHKDYQLANSEYAEFFDPQIKNGGMSHEVL